MPAGGGTAFGFFGQTVRGPDRDHQQGAPDPAWARVPLQARSAAPTSRTGRRSSVNPGKNPGDCPKSFPRYPCIQVAGDGRRGGMNGSVN